MRVMQEIGSLLRTPAAGRKVKRALSHFPQLSLYCQVSPITRTVLRIVTTVTPQFEWREQVHGHAVRWLLWVEDSDTEVIYHHEMWTLTRKMMQARRQACHLWFSIDALACVHSGMQLCSRMCFLSAGVTSAADCSCLT